MGCTDSFNPIGQCCDQRISEGYTAMSSKEEAKTVQSAKITGEEVELSATNPAGWRVIFDKQPTKVKLILMTLGRSNLVL